MGGTLLGLHRVPRSREGLEVRRAADRPRPHRVRVREPRRARAWETKLNELGIKNGGIVDAGYGSGLSFRDPDGIAPRVLRPARLTLRWFSWRNEVSETPTSRNPVARQESRDAACTRGWCRGTRTEEHRAATPLELFFDLTFVVAVAQASEEPPPRPRRRPRGAGSLCVPARVLRDLVGVDELHVVRVRVRQRRRPVPDRGVRAR